MRKLTASLAVLKKSDAVILPFTPKITLYWQTACTIAGCLAGPRGLARHDPAAATQCVRRRTDSMRCARGVYALAFQPERNILIALLRVYTLCARLCFHLSLSLWQLIHKHTDTFQCRP
jgi:hypothetical protein